MKVLVACEFSGIVRDAFISKGHDAISCDLLPTNRPGRHFKGSVFDLDFSNYDLMIAHPPCTYLCNSGVCHLYEKGTRVKVKERWRKMREAAEFFNLLLNCGIPKICIENPIPHKYGIGKTYTQIIQPWQHGHGETKATCLWLKNLPKLKPSNTVEGREGRVHKLPPGPDRWKIRSTTYQGIADAMAEQWG